MFVCLLITLVLLNFNDSANGCVCSEMTRKEVYDMSDFVSHVRILDKDETPGGTNMFYKVDHLQVFKLKPNDIQDKIFTSIFETSCGVVNLKNGQEYLLAGQSQNGKFRINACQAFADPDSGALRWELVDFSFRQQLETGYFNL